MNKTPVLFVAFNRADTLKKVFDAFLKCNNWKDRQLYIYLDAARNNEEQKKVQLVYELVDQYKHEHFKDMTIVRRASNQGCAGNITSAITELINQYNRLIIIEDDIVVAKYFLDYMDEALEVYKNDKRIWGINAWKNRLVKIPKDYKKDVYLHQRNMCWGWGTWKDRWEKVDQSMTIWPKFKADKHKMEKLKSVSYYMSSMFESQYKGILKTWDVQCSLHIVEHNLYCVEPIYSLTKNIGCGTIGSAHCKNEDVMISTQPFYNFKPHLERELFPDSRIERSLGLSDFDPRFIVKVIRKIKRIIFRYGSKFDDPIDI